jgi:hypothetical protein
MGAVPPLVTTNQPTGPAGAIGGADASSVGAVPIVYCADPAKGQTATQVQVGGVDA